MLRCMIVESMEPEGSECYNRNHSIQNLEDRKIKTFAANPQADIDIHGFLLCLIELLKSTERPVEEGLANPLLFFANPLTGTLWCDTKSHSLSVLR